MERFTKYVYRLRGFVVDEVLFVKKGMLIYRIIFNNVLCLLQLNYFRGEKFRGELLYLGEVHSLLPEGVHVMTLTATATKTLYEKIARVLGMYKSTIISVSPGKKNIIYTIKLHCSIEHTFRLLLMRLRTERVVTMLRTIMYCRKYEDCADLYMYFRENLENILPNHLSHQTCQNFI